MLTIKVFAKLTGIKESTLRYYDKLGIFSPLIRNNENGYRYYSPAQIIAVNAVRLMNELGMPTSDIMNLSKNRTPERIMDTLTDKEAEIESTIRNLQNTYKVINTIRRNIQRGISVDENRISVEYCDEIPVVLGPENDFSESEDFYLPFMNFCAESEKYHVDLRMPIGGWFENIGAFMDTPGAPTRFFSLDPDGRDTKVAGKYIMIYTRGNYGQPGDAAERVSRYLEDNGLSPVGPVYQIYLLDEISIPDPNQYLLQTSVMVE
jgi:DNA-binding transcriptional MerR regulator